MNKMIIFLRVKNFEAELNFEKVELAAKQQLCQVFTL